MSNFTVSSVLSQPVGCHFYTGKVSKVKEEQCSIYNSNGPNWLSIIWNGRKSHLRMPKWSQEITDQAVSARDG